MLIDEGARLLVQARDVELEGGPLDAPLAAAADLDCRQFTITHEGIGLCRRDVQQLCYIGKGEEPSAVLKHACIVTRIPRRASRCPQSCYRIRNCGQAFACPISVSDRCSFRARGQVMT